MALELLAPHVYSCIFIKLCDLFHVKFATCTFFFFTRGRAAGTPPAKADGAAKAPGKPSSKTQLSPSKSKQECSGPLAKPQGGTDALLRIVTLMIVVIL